MNYLILVFFFAQQIINDKKKYDPQLNLTVDEIAALNLYTTESYDRPESFYFILNGALRSNERIKTKPFLLIIKLILSALSKLPVFEGTVWRVMDGVDLRQFYQKGKTVSWNAFTSCTTDLGVCGAFMSHGLRTLINIQVTKAFTINDYSAFPTEHEVLVPPDSNFRVVDVLETGVGLFIIQLKQIA